MTPDDSRGRWIALIVCCSALFMTLLDVSVTNVALPSIGDDTGAGPAELQWIVSGYTLAFGLVPVLGGKLGDDHGRRLMFQVGVGGFAVTSLLSGLAPNAEILIAARVLQGLSGGLINPQVSGLVQQMFQRRGARPRVRRARHHRRARHRDRPARRRRADRARRARASAGGWSSSSTSRSASLVIFLARRLLPRRPRRTPHRLDYLGAAAPRASDVLRALRRACSTTPSATPGSRWLGVPAVVLGVLFFRRERRLTESSASRWSTSGCSGGRRTSPASRWPSTFFPAMAGLPLVLAIYYQHGLGYTAIAVRARRHGVRRRVRPSPRRCAAGS